MDTDVQIVQFRLLHLQDQNMCTCALQSSWEIPQLEYTDKKYLASYAFQPQTGASVRQQPQANTIGHSPKGGCRKANNILTSYASTSSLISKRPHVRPKKRGNLGEKGKSHETMHILTHYHCQLDLRSKYPVGTFTDAALLLFLQIKTKQVTKRTSTQKNMSCSVRTWSNISQHKSSAIWFARLKQPNQHSQVCVHT